VVRAEREEGERFRGVLAEALRRIEGISDTEHVRWYELLHFLLSWAVRRRPGEERPEWQEAVVASQRSGRHRREVEQMAQVAWKTFEEEVQERGERQGELRARREDLLDLLLHRFGTVPDSVRNRITTSEDSEKLRLVLRRVLDVDSPEQLEL
jgi:hypothetical protein